MEEEQIKRDLYLRSLLTGELQGPLTNKPSIDKPWLQYYDKNEIKEQIPRRSIYEDLCVYNKNNLDTVAIEYFNKKISYKELIENIEKVASTFSSAGLKKGDTVAVLMPYLPECIYTVYALNKLGVIVNMIDPRINSDLIVEYINNSGSKMAVIVDTVEEKIDKILPSTIVEKVISVSPTNSVKNIFIKTMGNLKCSKFTKWNKIVGKKLNPVESASVDADDLAVIEYTSGTSGKPKGVMLSNHSFNALAFMQHHSLKNEVGDKFLLIMPPFIAYGLVIGMHDMLSQGQTLIMVPNFTLDKAPEMLGKLIDKHHPNYIMGVPNFLTILMNYNDDLSFLKGIIIGGDHLDGNIEQDARDFFASKNSNAKILKGWGMTEIASCGVFTKTDSKNELGSVGIPLSKNNVKILPINEDKEKRYDIDGEELSYGKTGILFIETPSHCKGYFKNLRLSQEIFYVDKEGKIWINTGDVFKIDRSGLLYFSGREKRIVVRPDGHNIPSCQLENIASSFPEVEQAIVVGIPSRKYKHGSVATLMISFKNTDLSHDEKLKIFKKINNKCNEDLQPRDRAKYFLEISEIPYTMNGKIDYNHLRDNAILATNKLNIINEDSNFIYYLFNEQQKLNIKKR